MSKTEQAGTKPAAQPQGQDRSPARAKDQNRDAKQKGKDIAGADGPLSAGAEEDTYD
jgi:hypothetical protein